MFYYAFKKEYIKRLIAYFSLCCFFFTSQMPARIFADPCSPPYVTNSCPPSVCQDPCACPCTNILVDQEDAKRSKIATGLVGTTIVALIAGVIWLASGPSGKGHHSHSSCSSSSYSYCDSYYDSYCHHHHHHNNHHHHHSSHHHHRYYTSNPYSEFSRNDVTSFSGDYTREVTDPQFIASKKFPIKSLRSAGTKHSKESNELSGVFVTYPSLSMLAQGSMTAFVRLPDGTTQVLGSVPFSSSGGSSISYGPFTQKGTYTFGISMDGKTVLPSQFKVGSVEINVNGSTVESHDFFIPAHSPVNYEPHPCEYTLS